LAWIEGQDGLVGAEGQDWLDRDED